MPHPMKERVSDTYQVKHSRLTGNLAKAETPWQRAERISGFREESFSKMPPAPNEAVPQFTNDRSTRDVAYGSIPPKSDDD